MQNLTTAFDISSTNSSVRYFGRDYRRIARILGITQEIGLGRKLEAGRPRSPAAARFPRSRCNVFATLMPSPGRAEWSAMTRKPPGFRAANILAFIAARSTSM